MPDWLKAEDYAYCEGLSLHSWAWEFLRRNESYRQAWKDYLREVAAGGKLPNPAYFAASVPFGLCEPIDPALSGWAAGDKLSWAPDITTGFGVLSGWECRAPKPGEWPGFPAHIVICFDFRFPLAAQIAETTRTLRTCERELADKRLLAGLRENLPKGRARPDKYLLYIRLLDAHLAGATVYRIAKHFFKKDWTAANRSLRSAREMALGGYKALLTKPPAPTSK